MEKEIKLSIREKEVLQMITNAKCRKHIASKLNISIHTVDSHLRHLHLKTKTHSLTELVIWALNKLNFTEQNK